MSPARVRRAARRWNYLQKRRERLDRAGVLARPAAGSASGMFECCPGAINLQRPAVTTPVARRASPHQLARPSSRVAQRLRFGGQVRASWRGSRHRALLLMGADPPILHLVEHIEHLERSVVVGDHQDRSAAVVRDFSE